MEFDIGVPVTVLTAYYDATNKSPSGEIAEVLFVRLLCVELMGGDEQVVKVHAGMAAGLPKSRPPYHAQK